MSSPKHSADRWSVRILVGSLVFLAFILVAVTVTGARAGVPPVIDTSLLAPDLDVNESPDDTPKVSGSWGRACRFDPVVVPPLMATPHPAHGEPPHEYEAKLIEKAAHDCERASARHLDPWVGLQLVRLERTLGLPTQYAGLLLAVGCGEVAYSTDPNARGDGGKARGWTQTHQDGNVHQWCGSPDLDNLRENVTCWLSRVRVIAQGKALRKCGPRVAWRAAEAWVSQGGHSGYTCNAESGHWSRLLRWQRS